MVDGQDIDLVVVSSPRLRISARFRNFVKKKKNDYKSLDFRFFGKKRYLDIFCSDFSHQLYVQGGSPGGIG